MWSDYTSIDVTVCLYLCVEIAETLSVNYSNKWFSSKIMELYLSIFNTIMIIIKSNRNIHVHMNTYISVCRYKCTDR